MTHTHTHHRNGTRTDSHIDRCVCVYFVHGRRSPTVEFTNAHTFVRDPTNDRVDIDLYNHGTTYSRFEQNRMVGFLRDTMWVSRVGFNSTNSSSSW